MNLIDRFDKCRLWGGTRNPLLQKLRIYGIVNHVVAFAANVVLPIYFEWTKDKPCHALPKNSGRKKKVIISLTSFPKRIGTLHLTIESMLRQSVKPDKIILYLTKSQVPDIETLPKKLLDCRKRGLEIVLCDDEIRSHTKYFYAMQQYPDDVIITVDDDLFYRSDLVASHLQNAERFPDCAIANWAKRIVPGTDKYNHWPDVLGSKPKRSKNMLVFGVSSVLYPPHALHEDAFNVTNIRNLCLTADDVWLTAMLLKKGTEIVYSGYTYNHLPVHISNNETLYSGNCCGRNQTCIDNINKYYEERGEERPFYDIPLKNEKTDKKE